MKEKNTLNIPNLKNLSNREIVAGFNEIDRNNTKAQIKYLQTYIPRTEPLEKQIEVWKQILGILTERQDQIKFSNNVRDLYNQLLQEQESIRKSRALGKEIGLHEKKIDDTDDNSETKNDDVDGSVRVKRKSDYISDSDEETKDISINSDDGKEYGDLKKHKKEVLKLDEQNQTDDSDDEELTDSQIDEMSAFSKKFEVQMAKKIEYAREIRKEIIDFVKSGEIRKATTLVVQVHEGDKGSFEDIRISAYSLALLKPNEFLGFEPIIKEIIDPGAENNYFKEANTFGDWCSRAAIVQGIYSLGDYLPHDDYDYYQ